MTTFAKFLTTASLAGGLAAPLAAQYPYPQPYPQTQPYPYGYQQNYPYGYQQPYGGTVMDQVIGQLLGNRYNVTDRQAISRCANAAMVEAQNRYRGYAYGQGYGGYPPGYAYGQGIAAPNLRVTAITDVERRYNGLRVRGLIGTGYGGGYNQYGYDYRDRGYGDLSFRCTVDYRGYVSDVRVSRNGDYRRY